MTTTDPATDAALLAAFARTRSEAAFAELVRRHGPLVQGVCRRVLGDEPEADDAFQTAFLVLARKAGRVRDPGRLGPWLYGVAVRVAGKAKAARSKRQRRERPMGEVPAPQRDSDWADVRPVLDAEIARLPDKLQAALVLCELQQVSREDAAARLGVPAGTLSSRLARAKDELRRRLTRRGLTLSAAGLGAALTDAKAMAAVPAAVVETTAAAAAAVQPGGGSLVGKLLLMLLAAGGLTAAGVMLVPGDKPVDGESELVGRWVGVSMSRDGRVVEVPDGPHVAEFTADRYVVKGVPAKYAAYPKESPAQIDLTVLDGPEPARGRKIEGVYRVVGDTLTLHLAGKLGNPRPRGFDNRKGDESVLMVFKRERGEKPVTPPDPAAADKGKLQGKWSVVSAKLGGGREFPEKGVVGGSFEFAGDKVTVSRLGPDGKPRPEPATYRLDVTKSPKWIDLTSDNPRPVQSLPGLYELSGDELTLVFATPTKPRPTALVPKPDDPSTVVFTLRRPDAGAKPAAKPDPAAERAKLQGWWALESMTLVGGPKPRPFDDSWLHIDGDRWTTGFTDLDGKPQRTLYRLTLDLTQSPRRFDILHITPDGTPVRPQPAVGVYELAGDTLTVAQAWDPQPRPAGVTPETAGKDNYIYRYRRAAGPIVPKPRPAPPPTTLRGKWVVKSALHDGQPPPKDFPVVGKTVEATDDRFDVLGAARYVLYPKAKPAQIDLTVLDGPAGVRGDKIEGVYKREGDALVVHIAADDDQPRPTGFECKPGTKTTLLVLERVKPPAPPDPAAERAKLQGRWEVVAARFNWGQPIDPNQPGGWAEFAGDQLTFTRLHGPDRKPSAEEPVRFTLDPAAAPPRIDLTPLPGPGDKGPAGAVLGAYELAGDELFLAHGVTPGKRPTAARPTADDPPAVVYRLRRAKAATADPSPTR